MITKDIEYVKAWVNDDNNDPENLIIEMKTEDGKTIIAEPKHGGTVHIYADPEDEFLGIYGSFWEEFVNYNQFSIEGVIYYFESAEVL